MIPPDGRPLMPPGGTVMGGVTAVQCDRRASCERRTRLNTTSCSPHTALNVNRDALHSPISIVWLSDAKPMLSVTVRLTVQLSPRMGASQKRDNKRVSVEHEVDRALQRIEATTARNAPCHGIRLALPEAPPTHGVGGPRWRH